MTPDGRTYYEVLGISKDASQEEIEQAFQRKMAQAQPLLERQALYDAHRTLSDLGKRDFYDNNPASYDHILAEAIEDYEADDTPSAFSPSPSGGRNAGAALLKVRRLGLILPCVYIALFLLFGGSFFAFLEIGNQITSGRSDFSGAELLLHILGEVGAWLAVYALLVNCAQRAKERKQGTGGNQFRASLQGAFQGIAIIAGLFLVCLPLKHVFSSIFSSGDSQLESPRNLQPISGDVSQASGPEWSAAGNSSTKIILTNELGSVPTSVFVASPEVERAIRELKAKNAVYGQTLAAYEQWLAIYDQLRRDLAGNPNAETLRSSGDQLDRSIARNLISSGNRHAIAMDDGAKRAIANDPQLRQYAVEQGVIEGVTLAEAAVSVQEIESAIEKGFAEHEVTMSSFRDWRNQRDPVFSRNGADGYFEIECLAKGQRYLLYSHAIVDGANVIWLELLTVDEPSTRIHLGLQHAIIY